MEDGKDSEKPENQDPEDGGRNLKSAVHKLKAEAIRRHRAANENKPNQRSLRDATSLLKAEAIRRYREKHRNSLDRHEKSIEKDFAEASRTRAKKSPSPGATTPDIAEEGEYTETAGGGKTEDGTARTPSIPEEEGEGAALRQAVPFNSPIPPGSKKSSFVSVEPLQIPSAPWEEDGEPENIEQDGDSSGRKDKKKPGDGGRSSRGSRSSTSPHGEEDEKVARIEKDVEPGNDEKLPDSSIPDEDEGRDDPIDAEMTTSVDDQMGGTSPSAEEHDAIKRRTPVHLHTITASPSPKHTPPTSAPPTPPTSSMSSRLPADQSQAASPSRSPTSSPVTVVTRRHGDVDAEGQDGETSQEPAESHEGEHQGRIDSPNKPEGQTDLTEGKPLEMTGQDQGDTDGQGQETQGQNQEVEGQAEVSEGQETQESSDQVTGGQVEVDEGQKPEGQGEATAQESEEQGQKDVGQGEKDKDVGQGEKDKDEGQTENQGQETADVKENIIGEQEDQKTEDQTEEPKQEGEVSKIDDTQEEDLTKGADQQAEGQIQELKSQGQDEAPEDAEKKPEDVTQGEKETAGETDKAGDSSDRSAEGVATVREEPQGGATVDETAPQSDGDAPDHGSDPDQQETLPQRGEVEGGNEPVAEGGQGQDGEGQDGEGQGPQESMTAAGKPSGDGAGEDTEIAKPEVEGEGKIPEAEGQAEAAQGVEDGEGQRPEGEGQDQEAVGQRPEGEGQVDEGQAQTAKGVEDGEGQEPQGQGQTNTTGEVAPVEGEGQAHTAQGVEDGKGQEPQGQGQTDTTGEVAPGEGEGQLAEVFGQREGAEGQQESTGGQEETTGGQRDGEQSMSDGVDGQEYKHEVEAEKADGEGAATEGGKDVPADGQDPNTRGDEDEIMSIATSLGEDEKRIPDEHFYSFGDHVSQASISDESGLPTDMLTMHHSFGYDCQKRSNLHVLDMNTVVVAAGNVVQIIDLITHEHTYLRSTSGGGIGAIAVHPSRKYFAVAEKGSAPNINVFEFPSLKLHRIMRGGTEKAYAYVDFSPDGKLLASVGGEPDFMLTLWDWKQEKIVLRSKAFSQDVFRVTFSAELQGQLTSAGTGHIRFWKMAKTFTGLKLQGQLGKFGKKEISDIDGYVELPDGKVLSGSEWGNMLLWDGGLIKVEIGRKGRKPCHAGAIQQIILDEGELMTVGLDGYIRVWDFETVDTADSSEDSDVFEMEPMNELRVGTSVSLKSIVKSGDPENPTMWFAQDANGGIWKLDLSFSFTSLTPERMMSFHAGPISSCSTSPVSHMVATIGVDRTVRVVDYVAQEQLCTHNYNQPGTAVLWVPKTVDPSGATVLAGFQDGVVRVLTLQQAQSDGRRKKEMAELALRQAFKPHNDSVTALAIDSNGKVLASGSEDGTVFFLSIGQNYEPIGFTKTPAPVTHLEWAPADHKKNTLLVCCSDGQVLELTAPQDGKFDTSHSFEIQGLPTRTHKFKSIKSRLRHDEEVAKIQKEEELKKRQEEKERRIRIERGLETESEGGEEEEEKAAEKDTWEPYIPETPSRVLHGFHAKDSGKAWLSMGDFDAGYLYEVEFLDDEEQEKVAPDQAYEPSRTMPIYDSKDCPIQCMTFCSFGKSMALLLGHPSSNGKHLIMGLADGSVRIQPLRNDDVGLMGPYWSLNIHDNNYGKISHISVSHDNKFLITVGEDGNFFSYEIMDQEKLEQKIADSKARIPSARGELEEKKIDDIEDPKAYSIEDAKQKAEYDKMMRLAAEKKRSVAATIDELRDKFKRLIERNNELPEHLRLDRKEFEMDPEIARQLARHTDEKVEQVQMEMAWEEEKHRVALSKIRMRFMDVVECERVVIKAFMTPHEVATFRASRLSNDFYLAKAGMERRRTTMLMKDDGSRQATQDLLKAQREATEAQVATDATREGTDAKITTTLKGAMGERISKALAKVEEKKKKRAARKELWSELYETKPDDNYEDPADLSAITYAKENMGDYKLKSATDYVVPDHMRMNAEKARARLIILKELIHKNKYDFNQRLLQLRDKKISVISEIRDLVRDLVGVQATLGAEQAKPVPKVPRMHPEEMPEKKYEYTRETLLAFKEEFASRKDTVTAAVSDTDGGFGGFGAAGVAPPPDIKNAATPTPSIVKMGSAGRDRAAGAAGAAGPEEEVELTAMEKVMKQARQIRLLYERDHLLSTIDELLKNFDAELRCLRHEKFKLDIELKNADLRQVTLFEELLLLKDFEKQENVLADKVEGKQQDKLDMHNKVIEVQGKLESKKKDLERLVDKERALQGTFQASLGENNKFMDYLTKVFRKRIKRSKKKTTEGENSDNEDSDDDSSDDSDWSDSDEEEESEVGGFDLDVCPPGCDQNLYDNTCALREKRLDIEEALADEKKNRDAMNKDLESLQKKAKVIDTGMKNAEVELEAFQLEKQQKLNQLDVVVTLRLSQIQHMVNGALPNDLAPCLVFEAPGLVRLQTRIKELEHEKAMQKRQQKEARRKHIQLIKDRRLFENKIVEMEEQCNRMMLQKFGRIVDLEKLETVTVNRQLEELKEKLRQSELKFSNELSKWDDKILDAKGDITELIRENTNRLDQLHMLLGERNEYEGELDSRQKNLGSEYSGARKADVHERQRLIQLVHLQAQEIEALKDEIMLLSRKGGHILPPAQPPMPQSAQGQRPMPNS